MSVTLIAVLALLVVVSIVWFASKPKKSKTQVEKTTEESATSIHDEIAKTVEKAKNLAPIIDEVSKPKKPKKSAKLETAAPIMAAKKKVTPKAKKVNA